jgi:hypothetical protein
VLCVVPAAGRIARVVLPLLPMRRWLPVALALIALWVLGEVAMLATSGR